MTVQVRAHFDGQVLVPEEPVDLPLNQPLTVHIEVPVSVLHDTAARLAALERIASRAVSVNLPLEALTRESIYEDRR
jgi:hypothetical protein